MSVVLFLFGWAAAIFAGGWIPASAVAILSVALLAVQFRLALRCTEDSRQIARLLILGACFFGAGYFLGIAYLGAYAEAIIVDQDTYSGRQYFLYLRFGWLGDPDYLALYECTSTGLFCEVTYVAPSGDYNDRQLSIELDRETQVVGVQVDDRFSPPELTEADVGYLCDFFQIADEDSFCARSFFQDYASFRRMLRRNVGGDFSYPSIVPYFIRTGVFDVTTCPPPDTVLSSEQSSYTCRLHFPDSDLVLELRRTRSSYGNEVWYNVRLVNPNCNCDNR
ncbi:MAG: hypothetical protein IPK19_26275 [Chloroflexi bacterium]|nr:hypothetical protein [Chloroflexota bacterium]